MRYVLVEKKPEELKKGEYYIAPVTFIEEVKGAERLLGANKITGVNYIRAVVNSIGANYDQNLNGFKVVPYNYIDRKVTSAEEANKMFIELLQKQKPEIFASYIETQIKKAPFGTELIYFNGTHLETAPFTKNGIYEIKDNEISEYLDKKSHKTLNKSQQKVKDIAKNKDSNQE